MWPKLGGSVVPWGWYIWTLNSWCTSGLWRTDTDFLVDLTKEEIQERELSHRVISNDSFEDLEGHFEIVHQRSLFSYHSKVLRSNTLHRSWTETTDDHWMSVYCYEDEDTHSLTCKDIYYLPKSHWFWTLLLKIPPTGTQSERKS